MTQRNDKVTATVQVGGMINYTPCSIEVGEVTTLPAGSDATVTNSGNEYEAVFDFGIPQGAKGDTGETGATGKSAYESAVEQGYEGTEEEFATSLTTVDTKAAQAAASATAAAGSATSASNSATSASNSATTATTKASEASASATAAAASATSAGSNATAAQNYVTQASTFASNASNSATNAASYASNAASSATNASAMASSASTSASSASASADTASAVLTDPDFVAVAGAVEDITTVATNISDVNATGQAIEDVSAVADNLTDISLVANDLENIDAVATNVAEWQKPADWVDIRSGALPNSVYFLAAHKKDYSDYASFGVTVWVKNSGTYDVYVDGVKYATGANGTETVINWQTLNLASGYDVTYPQELRTHIVRVTQSDPTKNLDRVMLGEADSTGVNKKSTLWVHCNMNYSINFNQFVGNTRGRMTDSLLEAVTSRDGVLKCTNITQMIGGQINLKTIPILDMADSNGMAIPYFAYNSYANNLTNVHIRNLHQTGNKSNAEAFSYSKFKQIIFENSEVCWDAWMFQAYCLGLEKVPEGLYHPTGEQPLVVKNGWWNLKDTVLDLSQRTGLTYVQIRGNSNSQRLDSLKGLTVSPSAPLNGTSPQINVSYTGLDRKALVNLFNSMPTASNSQVCDITGATGAANLTAEDLAIATNKGWTVTR